MTVAVPSRTRSVGGLAGQLRALSYLLEHPTRSGAIEVPEAWPWFAPRFSRGPVRLTGVRLNRARECLARHAPGPDPLGDAYQQLLRDAHPGARRRGGSFYTPANVASRLTAEAVDPLFERTEPLTPRVCDPACGSGRFLLAAARLIAGRRGDDPPTRRAIVEGLLGIDADPVAAELCRFNLARWAGVPRSEVARAVRWADALAAPVEHHSFDAVVGNPPFLNQLQSATARSAAARKALSARFPGAVRPYTDAAAIFLLRGLELLRPGGRIALIQPVSLLAARDAEPVRRALAERCTLEGLWTAGPGLFGAQVYVCALILHATAGTRAPIRRWRGPDFTPHPSVPQREADPANWAPLADTDTPRFSWRAGGTLADLATATADFRDQFYGLRGCMVEDGALTAPRRRVCPRLITTGLIDPAACLWGRRPCRLLGTTWAAPRADADALGRNGLGPWSRARLIPKVLLATQTRILEALADPRGDLLPVTPIITVVPRDPAHLWLIAAALLSPVLTAHALRLTAGAGLSAGAIKLSAKQTLTLPIPERGPPWTRAAELVQAAHQAAKTRPALLLSAGELMCRAYGLDAATTRRLLAWYSARRPL